MNGKGRNNVGTYRGVGSLRRHAEGKTSRARQDTVLPPRCTYCRLPGIHMIDGEPRCDGHLKGSNEDDT